MNVGSLVWLVILAVFVVALIWSSAQRRRAATDEIFAGLTPGLLPVPPDPGVRELVKPGPEYAGPIAVAFNPPKGVRAGLAGTIVDNHPQSRDVMATIVDLAARGFLTIKVVESTATRNGRDWELTATSAKPGAALEPGERSLLADLFVHGSPVLLSSLPAAGNHAFDNAQRQLWDECAERGWFRAPAATRMPRSAEGTAVRIQALAFKQYLATAEKEQFSYEEAAGIFSKYLPYAIVLGVAEHWTKVFGDLAAQAQLDGVDADFDLFWLSMAGWGVADAMFDLAMFGALADGLDGFGFGGGDFFGDGAIDSLGADAMGDSSFDTGFGDGGFGDSGFDAGGDAGGWNDVGGGDSGGSWGDFGGSDFGGGDFGGGDFGGGFGD